MGISQGVGGGGGRGVVEVFVFVCFFVGECAKRRSMKVSPESGG